jgi:uracil-DNA glycosylase
VKQTAACRNGAKGIKMSQTTGGVRGEFLSTKWLDFIGSDGLNLLRTVEVGLKSKVGFFPEVGVYHAFNLCAPEDVRVVVLGQDPYHGKGQAHGLAFSVQPGIAIPPSLRNILKELKSDLGQDWLMGGDLTFWAQNGVLLLNSILTVDPGMPGSHRGLGWEEFTDCVLNKISEAYPNVVFVLWGAFAKKKAGLLVSGAKVLLGNHPSPMSANRGGFFEGKYFSKTNQFLASRGVGPIAWIQPGGRGV